MVDKGGLTRIAWEDLLDNDGLTSIKCVCWHVQHGIVYMFCLDEWESIHMQTCCLPVNANTK